MHQLDVRVPRGLLRELPPALLALEGLLAGVRARMIRQHAFTPKRLPASMADMFQWGPVSQMRDPDVFRQAVAGGQRVAARDAHMHATSLVVVTQVVLQSSVRGEAMRAAGTREFQSRLIPMLQRLLQMSSQIELRLEPGITFHTIKVLRVQMFDLMVLHLSLRAKPFTACLAHVVLNALVY